MKINFDIIIPTPKGMIFAMDTTKCEGEIAGVSADAKVNMTIQQAHANEDVTRKTAKILG